MKTVRSSGIILHITSLPGPFGIGDLGPAAYRFGDFLAEAGVGYWQLLPLNPTSKGAGYSPYSSTSAFAGNTMLISPELLVKDGYLSDTDIQTDTTFKADPVEFEKAFAFKNALLRKAFDRFQGKKNAGQILAYQNFCRKQASWLDDYALYTVLNEKYEQVSWLGWPKEIRNRNASAITEVTKNYREQLDYVRFTQFLFYQQWNALRGYCNQKNILFFGDLPFYVSFESAEVWANPEIFKLDARRRSTAVSGVPPDYFSETGQLWGTPVYNWKKLKATNYAWWVQRMAHNLALFDVARIDHFRALYDYWEVKAGEKTAVNGKWKMGPADDFFKTLQKHFPEMPFIAEDLGEVGPGVYELRDRWNLPGMAVLQYGFGEDIATSPFIAHNFTENIVAYTGTHDNNTTKGWFRNELKDADKERLNIYLNQKLNASNVSLALIKLALMSVSNLAIIPLQDYLNLDERAIMNKPSTGEGNWKWRVTEEQLKSLDPREIKELLQLYNRVTKKNLRN